MSDYSNENWEVTICTFGIMGTRYVRDDELPTEIEIIKGDSYSLLVPNIYSEHEIATELIIALRLPTGPQQIPVTFDKQTYGKVAVNISTDEVE